MSAKETTLQEIGETLAFIVERMATKDDIARLDGRMDSFESRMDSVESKMDVGFAGVMSELAEIKQRLRVVEEAVENHSGFAKEIDYALRRIAVIEKHLGIKPVEA